MVDLASWEQPPLFASPKPICLRFEVLIDPEDETCVIVVQAKDVLRGSLLALQSSSPVPFERAEAIAREHGARFTELLRTYTSPFP